MAPPLSQDNPIDTNPFDVGIIGAGPAGLMAAEVIAATGLRVTVFDASASAGRKFLLAGKGGLNLTHSEPLDQFIARYHGGSAGSGQAVESWLRHFGPQQVRDWCATLGVETFVGSSGRVFPTSLKAAPLLRAWLHRLRGQGVRFAMRHRWTGWDAAGQPQLVHAGAPVTLPHPPRAWVLALGGASWPQLGSDGAWVPWLRQSGVAVKNLQASNCAFAVGMPQPDGSLRAGWSDHLRSRFAGSALKNVAATVRGAENMAGSAGANAPAGARDSSGWTQSGELLLNETGIEGHLVYAASSRLRERLQADRASPPRATLWINLLPAFPAARVIAEVTRPRGARSWPTHLKSRLGLDGVKLALLYEVLPKNAWHDEQAVARTISALPITVTAPRPIEEAISSAGGIEFDALSHELELLARPGIFCAGEMLDWDAPTGGYLLTACLASGRVAGEAAARHCR